MEEDRAFCACPGDPGFNALAQAMEIKWD